MKRTARHSGGRCAWKERAVLSLYRRHLKTCPNAGDRFIRKGDKCPVWVEGVDPQGAYHRKSLRTGSWDIGERLMRDMMVPAAPGLFHDKRQFALNERRFHVIYRDAGLARNPAPPNMPTYSTKPILDDTDAAEFDLMIDIIGRESILSASAEGKSGTDRFTRLGLVFLRPVRNLRQMQVHWVRHNNVSRDRQGPDRNPAGNSVN